MDALREWCGALTKDKAPGAFALDSSLTGCWVELCCVGTGLMTPICPLVRASEQICTFARWAVALGEWPFASAQSASSVPRSNGPYFLWKYSTFNQIAAVIYITKGSWFQTAFIYVFAKTPIFLWQFLWFFSSTIWLGFWGQTSCMHRSLWVRLVSPGPVVDSHLGPEECHTRPATCFLFLFLV